jgi:NADH-quinone oxidoreductase subunit F
VTLRKVLTERWGVADSHRLAVAEKHGAYEAWKKIVRDKTPPAQVIAEVKSSGLRGRGGAGFPTGQKWSFVPQNTGKPIYLCVNADESEPGTNKDREIIERDPHQLIEGAIIAAYAINAKTAFLYIRGEFDLPLRRMEEAVAEAFAAGYLGRNVLGSGFDLDFLIHRGAGAYICGEETALLSSLEGNRGEPKIKPPFPAVKGAFACPTIVNNVESIAAVPWIIRNGAAAYSAMGTEKSKGTKVISVSGRVKKPGNYEIELGHPLHKLIFEDCGGMVDGYRLKAVIPGGSSVPVVKAEAVDKINLDYESCQASGTLLGSAGLIVIDHTQDMVHLLTVLARFYSHESCGQCTPCREGTGWAHRILEKIESGQGTPADLDILKSIATGMSGATICFLADSLAMPITSFLKNFPEEFEAKVAKAVPA